MSSGRIPPVIKWSGSKRAVAADLAKLIPPSDRYFEPFVGGGALLPYRAGTPAVAGDVIPELIALWTEVRDRPDELADAYERRWAALQARGHSAFYEIRDAFNRHRRPEDLLFLSRTCVNGLIRFNARRDFNNSLHHTRPGIAPQRLRRVLQDWSRWTADVSFKAQDYRTTLQHVGPRDFVFLDPPYAATAGRYHKATFGMEDLFEELTRLTTAGAKWMLTYDGSAGGREYEVDVPSDLYVSRFSVSTGHSPFPRLLNSRQDRVAESVFLNFEPFSETQGQLFDAA